MFADSTDNTFAKNDTGVVFALRIQYSENAASVQMLPQTEDSCRATEIAQCRPNEGTRRLSRQDCGIQ